MKDSVHRKRILVVTPRFPFDFAGACEQDRAQGVSFLAKLGYDVTVITMCHLRHLHEVSKAEEQLSIKVIPVLYSSEVLSPRQRFLRNLGRLFVPLYWDGASHEFRRREIVEKVVEVIETFKPDLVWYDSTYLWPLHSIARKRNIPIITRSLNYEPLHFLGKTRQTLFDYARYLVKLYGERRAIRGSDLVFSIAPKEKVRYEAMSTTPIVNLPLRRLGELIGRSRTPEDRVPVNVCFMGINYSIHHMLQGLLFILNEVNPLLQKRYPDTFTLHIAGGKIPESIRNGSYPGVHIHGYVEDFDAFLQSMDIALSPSLSGEGMQQKVFEPIARGIPTVTSPRALAGYPFIDGIHVITPAEGAESFVEALGKLRDASERKRISENAVGLAEHLFSDALLMEIMERNITKLTHQS